MRTYATATSLAGQGVNLLPSIRDGEATITSTRVKHPSQDSDLDLLLLVRLSLYSALPNFFRRTALTTVKRLVVSPSMSLYLQNLIVGVNTLFR